MEDLMNTDTLLARLSLSPDVAGVLSGCRSLTIANTVEDLRTLSVCGDAPSCEVAYDVPGKGRVVEAIVCRVKNGISANYIEPYMRRRDPDSMLIGDDLPSDKERYADKFGQPFAKVRQETLDWLKTQDLAIFVFRAGQQNIGLNALAIAPANAGFFALGLGLLQGVVDLSTVEGDFPISTIVYTAPPFRHTHFAGKQIVVHNRSERMHEIFSYNLYPGPSAKKGIYGALIERGEREGWITAHASCVQVVTPYDMRLTIMHEGASGGGKSEMLEHFHRENDGSILFAKNIETEDEDFFTLSRGCDLKPVTDDMALCHPSMQKGDGKLVVCDAEAAWFIRVDHINSYGTDPDIEARSIHPAAPLLFLNIDAQPGSTALLWEHKEDAPGVPCPNPRFVLPRQIVPAVVNKPVSVDVRSFGVRMPPCTSANPTYGILGLFHVLPPALAWLWRLVSPRGHANPSVTASDGMGSEGIGSWWPFATGLRANGANLLLQQIIETPKVRYVLCPNQHIGAWKVGFTPQWVMREYLARRGGVRFAKRELVPARSSLAGFALSRFVYEGRSFDPGYLRVELQPEVGTAAYDHGATALKAFFEKELAPYVKSGAIDPLGKQIIDCCLQAGSVDDYLALMPVDDFFLEE